MDLAEMALRLRKVEEVEKIKELRAHRFPSAGDPELDVEAAVALFAPDAELEYVGLGSAKGHREIRAFFQDDPVTGRFLCMVPAYVHVNDDLRTGTGRWHLLETAKIPSHRTGRVEPVWSECSYDDEYVKHDGVWVFQRYKCVVRMLCSHADGWGENAVDFGSFFADWKETIAS